MTFWKHNKKKNITGQKLFVVELQFFATFKFQACTLTHTKITNFKQLLFSHFSQEKKSTFFLKRPYTCTSKPQKKNDDQFCCYFFFQMLRIWRLPYGDQVSISPWPPSILRIFFENTWTCEMKNSTFKMT